MYVYIYIYTYDCAAGVSHAGPGSREATLCKQCATAHPCLGQINIKSNNDHDNNNNNNNDNSNINNINNFNMIISHSNNANNYIPTNNTNNSKQCATAHPCLGSGGCPRELCLARKHTA